MIELRQKKGEDYDMPQMLVYLNIITYKPQRTIFQRGFATDIQEVINPDAKVSRYNRTWRFSKPKILNGFLVGKMGFTSLGTEKRADYNEDIKDFVEQTVDAKSSTFVLWVVDLSQQILAFEIKPPDIRYQSFKGAFEGFLYERPDIGFSMENIVETSQFLEWVKTVDKVTKFTANLRTPNPDYSKHPKFIHDVLENPNADRAKIELVKLSESIDSLNTENTIKDIVEYGEKGYSSIVARGEKGEQLRIFDSKRRFFVERMSIPDGIDNDAKWKSIIKAISNFVK